MTRPIIGSMPVVEQSIIYTQRSASLDLSRTLCTLLINRDLLNVASNMSYTPRLDPSALGN
jgi:hypothetical protein